MATGDGCWPGSDALHIWELELSGMVGVSNSSGDADFDEISSASNGDISMISDSVVMTVGPEVGYVSVVTARAECDAATDPGAADVVVDGRSCGTVEKLCSYYMASMGTNSSCGWVSVYSLVGRADTFDPSSGSAVVGEWADRAAIDVSRTDSGCLEDSACVNDSSVEGEASRLLRLLGWGGGRV